MPQTDHDRVIALAGLFQATHLVRNIARTGQCSPEEFETCITSLFKIDAADSEDIYGGIRHLRTGLQLFVDQLRQPAEDREVTRYALTLLALERKLRRKPEMLQKIRQQIDATQDKLQYFELTHHNIVASLAEAYSATASTLSPRVMVNGEHVHLTRKENADRIRALLLAGLRAAVLWRQSGGGRLLMLLRYKKLIAEAQRLLRRIKGPVELRDVNS
jgi:high frequency lysogenization protein